MTFLRTVSVLIAINLVAPGCGDVGLFALSTADPPPTGALPPTQTIEGGAQIEVSRSGFAKITARAPALFASSLGVPVCIAEQSVGGTNMCHTTDGACMPGC